MNKTRPLPTPDSPSLSRSETVRLLSEAFARAREAALAADPGPCGDDTSPNVVVDSPVFHLPRQISTFLIGVAAHSAGIDAERFSWNKHRWFYLDDFLDGHGKRRTAMAHAAAEALRAAGFPGLKVRVRRTEGTPDQGATHGDLSSTPEAEVSASGVSAPPARRPCGLATLQPALPETETESPISETPYPHWEPFRRDATERELEVTQHCVIASAYQLEAFLAHPEGKSPLDLADRVDRVCETMRLWRFVRMPDLFPWAAVDELEAQIAEMTGEERR